MPVTLKLCFPAGRYHATPWGRHVNEGIPEWPPSPWRLLRALVATWLRKCPGLAEASVRRVLDQLLLPPLFQLPPARVAHTRHYMPLNTKSPVELKGGGTTLVFDTFVALGRREPVIAHWPDATLSADDTRTLCTLVENLTTLGRAEGWVCAEVMDSGVRDWNCRPVTVANVDEELVSVLSADPESALSDEHYPPAPDAKKLKKGLKPGDYFFNCPRWHLCLDTETIHSERWPRVPGTQWVSYVRRADAFTQSPARVLKSSTRQPTIARFLIDGPVLPLATDTIRVAEAFRHALLKRYQQLQHLQHHGTARKPYQQLFRSEVLSGKDAVGRFLTEHGHAHYLPTAEGDDPRRLTHVTVWAPRGFDPAETTALTGIRTWDVANLRLHAQLIGLGQPHDFRASVCGGPDGAARVWTSATPYVGPAHVGRCHRERFLRKALRRELRRWAARQPCPVTIESVEQLTATDPGWHRRPQPFEYRRRRTRTGVNDSGRPFGIYRVTLSTGCIGPLCLGYAAHYGLGLLLPAEAVNASTR